MSNESRNAALVALAMAAAVAMFGAYVFHAKSVERHNAQIERENDRRALQARRDREQAFEKECREMNGKVLLFCPSYCVERTALLSVMP